MDIYLGASTHNARMTSNLKEKEMKKEKKEKKEKT